MNVQNAEKNGKDSPKSTFFSGNCNVLFFKNVFLKQPKLTVWFLESAINSCILLVIWTVTRIFRARSLIPCCFFFFELFKHVFLHESKVLFACLFFLHLLKVLGNNQLFEVRRILDKFVIISVARIICKKKYDLMAEESSKYQTVVLNYRQVLAVCSRQHWPTLIGF